MAFIYTLNCPVSGDVRYVGKATAPIIRHREHLSRPGKTHKGNWIRSLLGAGLLPVLEIIDKVQETEWQALEAAYIQFFREQGANLTNSTEGGEGIGNPSEETRAKMSAAKLGKTHSPEHCAAQSAALIGRKYLPESYETRRGKKRSPETCAKMRTAQMGNKNALGYKHSVETRAKVSETIKTWWALRKGKI